MTSHESTSAVDVSMIRNLSRQTLDFLAERANRDEHLDVTEENQLRPLHCVAQKYAWGRMGSTSTVARMKEAQALQEEDDEYVVDEDKPYAELWLGTHPNGMSTVTMHRELQHGLLSKEPAADVEPEKRNLLDYVRSDPFLHCGDDDMQDLSFLLKVLSVRTVLSIQAHPDKKLAERLHRERPHIYKDPNHKPEMAIAISDKVSAMCGFRPIAEIAQHLDEYPELRAIVGEEISYEVQDLVHSPATRAVLQHMFKSYIESSDEQVHEQVEIMTNRLKAIEKPNELQKLILKISKQFPGDCGIFAPLIFNIVELERGEALFIAANEPHAYISGEMVECMACSDNVVRAGLTPKLKDVPTLVDMLTYKSQMPETTRGEIVDECTIRYEPPVPDFCVEMIYVPAGKTYIMSDVHSPAVVLTLQGEASLEQGEVCSLDVSYGTAAFLSANTRCAIVAGPNGVQLTRGFTNVYHDDFKYAGLDF